ncbi:hypothetical protein EV421DRAFT_1733302 [Armillaria borealis]|uniref:Uncharacterized protein n=1 Tax=Armillaria borealis TaxID=47425 RepID=A0AA39MW14_9AGAR|nr:hypothetical protein EV421DRAFT_1733302 [Armillaria borealis]
MSDGGVALALAVQLQDFSSHEISTYRSVLIQLLSKYPSALRASNGLCSSLRRIVSGFTTPSGSIGPAFLLYNGGTKSTDPLRPSPVVPDALVKTLRRAPTFRSFKVPVRYIFNRCTKHSFLKKKSQVFRRIVNTWKLLLRKGYSLQNSAGPAGTFTSLNGNQKDPGIRHASYNKHKVSQRTAKGDAIGTNVGIKTTPQRWSYSPRDVLLLMWPSRSTGSSPYRDRGYLASNVQGVQAQDLKRPDIAR